MKTDAGGSRSENPARPPRAGGATAGCDGVRSTDGDKVSSRHDVRSLRADNLSVAGSLTLPPEDNLSPPVDRASTRADNLSPRGRRRGEELERALRRALPVRLIRRAGSAKRTGASCVRRLGEVREDVAFGWRPEGGYVAACRSSPARTKRRRRPGKHEQCPTARRRRRSRTRPRRRGRRGRWRSRRAGAARRSPRSACCRAPRSTPPSAP